MCQFCSAGLGHYDASETTAFAGQTEAASAGYVYPLGHSLVDGVLIGTRWTSSVNYSFPTDASPYVVGGYYADSVAGITAVSAQQMAAVRSIMEGTGLVSFESVCNISITEVSSSSNSSVSDIMIAQCNTFGGSNLSTARVADFPGALIYPYFPTAAGDVWFGDDGNQYRSPVIGNYAWITHIHELGHAFGLKHGHSPDGINGFSGVLPYSYDSMEYSVMTYRSYAGASTTGGYTNAFDSYAQTLMMADIAALQYIYGIDYGTNSGNTTYTWSTTTGETLINGVGQGTPAGNKIFMTVWDGGGVDTYDMSNSSANHTIDLRPGSYSVVSTGQLANLGNGHFASGNVYNALQWNGDTRSLIENAVGGSGNDTLVGNDVGNSLDGRGGNNTFYGFGGGDYITASGSTNIALGGEGTDQIYFATGSNQLYGENGNDWLGVNGNANALIGGEGDDYLTGGGTSNTLVCGNGADYVNFTGDGNYCYGEGGSDFIYFSSGNSNQLFGGDGTDWLGINGISNALLGGAGNDWLGASGSSNSVVGGGGGDTLFAYGTTNYLYSQDGAGGGTWLGVSGSSNFLFGNLGNDWLGASGNNNTFDPGAGNDTMVAAAGHTGDVFIFRPGYGHDNITGFAPGAGATDVIDMRGFGLTYSNLINNYTSDISGGVFVNLGGDDLTLYGVTKAQLTSGDFLLS